MKEPTEVIKQKIIDVLNALTKEEEYITFYPEKHFKFQIEENVILPSYGSYKKGRRQAKISYFFSTHAQLFNQVCLSKLKRKLINKNLRLHNWGCGSTLDFDIITVFIWVYEYERPDPNFKPVKFTEEEAIKVRDHMLNCKDCNHTPEEIMEMVKNG